MAPLKMQPGAELDGFTIGERVHRGGMATLWSVTAVHGDRGATVKAGFAGGSRRG